MEYRIEKDTMGEVKVPNEKYWGAQTQRSHENFEIGVGLETMPKEVIEGFAYLKKACALVNRKLGRLDEPRTEAIAQAWVEPGMPADLLTQGSHHADQEQHGDDSCHSRPEGVPHLGSGESGLP